MRIHIHIKVIYYGIHVSLWGMNRINWVSAGDSATLGSWSCSSADLIVHNGYTGVF